MRTETLEVHGMMCGGCEQRVRDAVTAIPGVIDAVPEHIGDEVEVTFDPARVALDAIRAAIAAEGFAVGQPVWPAFTNP
ncbi:MAG TPA: heavy-metal-associated domain-containing protein [Gaiellales bacterium]